MTVLGGTDLPVVLDACARCGERNVDILHPLCGCPATASLYDDLAASTQVPDRVDRFQCARVWFSTNCPLPVHTLFVRYVGRCLYTTLADFHEALQEDEEEGPLCAQRVDALLRMELLPHDQGDDADDSSSCSDS